MYCESTPDAVRRLLGALALAGLGVAPVVQAAEEAPQRQAGSWQMKTRMQADGGMAAGMGGSGQQFEVCVGENEDRFADPQGADQCTAQQIQRKGERLIVESTCQVEGSTAVSRAEFTGSFTRDYRGEVVTRYTPPLEGMRESRMQIEGRWVGPCKPGQAPGSLSGMKMEMPGGGGAMDLDALRRGQMPDPAQMEQMQKMLEQMQKPR